MQLKDAGKAGGTQHSRALVTTRPSVRGRIGARGWRDFDALLERAETIAKGPTTVVPISIFLSWQPRRGTTVYTTGVFYPAPPWCSVRLLEIPDGYMGKGYGLQFNTKGRPTFEIVDTTSRKVVYRIETRPNVSGLAMEGHTRAYERRYLKKPGLVTNQPG